MGILMLLFTETTLKFGEKMPDTGKNTGTGTDVMEETEIEEEKETEIDGMMIVIIIDEK